MGVQGPGESVDKMLRAPPPSHPFAVPPSPGTVGVWQIRRVKEAPIGYVVRRPSHGVPTFHAYAHCRDDEGKRPWLHEFSTLNAAAAWMMQHERQLREFNARHGPETQVWPQ
jgi:hypothetical protein